MSLQLRGRTTARIREKNYKLFAVNFHGKVLQPIRDEFKRRVRNGLRRSVFIIDLEEEKAKVLAAMRKTTLLEDGFLRKSKKDPPRRTDAIDLLHLTQAAIERCIYQHDAISRRLEQEKNFDLLEYFLKNSNANVDKRASKQKSIMNASRGAKAKKTGRFSTLRERPSKASIQCPTSFVREHNYLGNEHLLNKKFIGDEPADSSLYIIIIGDLNDKYYLDLLSRFEPLQAVTHFIPQEGSYEAVIPNPKVKQLVLHIFEEILQSYFDTLRRTALPKPTGLFHQYLPIISVCAAQKLSSEIFDQLCWYFYDIEVLHQNYKHYYVQPFKEIDVSGPPEAKLDILRKHANSLKHRGDFLRSELPMVGTDKAVIAMYLDRLFNAVSESKPLIGGMEALLLSTGQSNYTLFGISLPDLLAGHKDAFASITKFRKLSRLVVETNNNLLYSMVRYADHELFQTIFLTCLEYNTQRKLFFKQELKNSFSYRPYIEDEVEPYYLPNYVKFYPTEDGFVQRLTHFKLKYDDVDVEEIYPGFKLYHFSRKYCEDIEQRNLFIIPTRLCFRDFTLYQMDEFLDNLVTPAMREEYILESLTEEERNERIRRQNEIEFDPNIFVRLNSLKARKLRSSDVRSTMKRTSKLDKRATSRFSRIESRQQSRVSAVDTSFVGLPPGHHLLKGYNLEDIRQEVKRNMSKFYFEEGHIHLLQEDWNFAETNKKLEFALHNCTITLCRRDHTSNSISKSILLRTKNDISMRILEIPGECCKVLFNYPNGLSVFNFETYAEQIWSIDNAFNGERKRIFTPYGAIIVFFKKDNMTLIMRYNGEVYQLYQYTFDMEGEEEGFEISSSSQNNTPGTISVKTSRVLSKLGMNIPTETIEPSVQNLQHTKRKKKKAPKGDLVFEMENELRFLDHLMTLYGLTYLHLKFTTSTGRVINRTHRGRLFEEHRLKNIEWHDYFTNESFAMRSDGVKMIWTHDALKCFHADGTTLITQTKESVFILEDDEDITQSSSHEEEVETETNNSVAPFSVRELAISLLSRWQEPKQKLSYKNFLLTGAEEAEQEAEDTSYRCYMPKSHLMQHKHYAAIFLLLLEDSTHGKNILIEVYGIDDIRTIVTKESPLFVGHKGKEDDFVSEEENTVEESQRNTTASTVVDDTYKDEMAAKNLIPIVKVSIASNLDLYVTEEAVEINARLKKIDEENGESIENLTLKFEFFETIPDLYNKLVMQITQFKNWQKKKTEHVYFLEMMDEDCCSKGLEFLDQLPALHKFNYGAGNYVVDFQPIITTNESMLNNYEWYNEDIKKFPRFHKRIKPCLRPICEFPSVLSVDVYCKVPRLLRNSNDIYKFMEPFAAYSFKKLRRFMHEAMDFHLRPEVRALVKRFSSKRCWSIKSEKREFEDMERQKRIGLYRAILKHEKYPKYFQYKDEFCSHPKFIDFFKFVVPLCLEKEQSEDSMQRDMKLECGKACEENLERRYDSAEVLVTDAVTDM